MNKTALAILISAITINTVFAFGNENKRSKEINAEELTAYNDKLTNDNAFCLIKDALSRNYFEDVAFNWESYSTISHTFSHKIKTELGITDQARSGRCWIFAGTNLMRVPFIEKHNLTSFEFSESYVFFYDKLEKANYFLENIIATAKEDLDSQILNFLLNDPLSDGGFWNMFSSIVKKYGIVPKSVFPDSNASLDSRDFNKILQYKLKHWASQLRTSIKDGASDHDLQTMKAQMIKETYRILGTHFGIPPSNFDWEYMDKDNKYHIHQNLSPRSFLDDFVDFPFDDMVCLAHSPRPTTPQKQVYELTYITNVLGGDRNIFYNTDIDTMKTATLSALKDNAPVYFACDVRHYLSIRKGVMDRDIYNYGQVYNTAFDMDRVTQLEYKASAPTHAMLFTGVNLIDDKPNRWRVENSWGTTIGDSGYFVMTDDWFDEYMFEVIIDKKYLTDDIWNTYNKEPQPLPPWDPMAIESCDMEDDMLIDITEVIPEIVIDLKYATDDNFVNTAVYKSDRCYALSKTAQQLKAVQEELKPLGLQIKIWDIYRPMAAQQIFWDILPDPRYISDPKTGGRHTRGTAVDLTLIREDGSELEMPTGFDDFTEKAHRKNTDCSETAMKNRQLLEDIMTKHGFVGLPTEWWHFDLENWQDHPPINL